MQFAVRTIWFILIFAVSASLFCCKKDQNLNSEPSCIHSRVDDFEKSNSCSSANVKKYFFQGTNVYAFDPGTCGADMTTEVIAGNCKTLGYLGGISGNTTINGEKFSKAVFISTIWQR